MGSQPALQSLKTFQSATSGGRFRGRDELQPLDYALSQWQEYGTTMTADDREKMLRYAISEAEQWLANKTHKLANNSTALVRKREAAIRALLEQLGDVYRFEQFRANKGQGRIDQNQGMHLKGLSGNYIFEATAQPKGVAHPSASDVMHYAKQKGLNVNYKESYVVARDQFVADSTHGRPTEQLYYDRATRMRYLLLPIGGKLYSTPTTPATVRGAYAMDEYGNLFAQESPVGTRAFNHSTFCRGKAVACAGIIDVNMGELFSINNMSGHYKPAPAHVANCLRILQGQGIDISKCEVLCALGPGLDSDRQYCGVHTDPAVCRAAEHPLMRCIFSKAASFLQNPNGNGLQIVDPKTFQSQAQATAAAATPHIEFAHVG